MAPVMMIDNEQMTLDLLGQVVRLLGHHPIPASSGAKALQLLQDGSPQLILIDLMMPEMDGYETMRRIRGLPGGAQVPIVVMTASQEIGIEEHVADAGGDKICYKPISVAKLSDVLNEYLAPKFLSDTAPLSAGL